MDQYIGKFLDNRYEILERIGSGGMAVVYKAKCHRLNRFVAVKILKEDLAQDEEFRRRFHEESRAVAMLSHPNIVAVYDVSRGEAPDYIVMELIDGITLKQYTQKKGGKLTWKEALHFSTQITKALSHAHSRGIIHRDIKPHNIMVLRDGSLKVTDFGIARLMSASQSTMTQEALGSVHYISPEQAKGSRIDARSDIYSAGVVLYEMLTGRLPYEGDSPVAVAIQHINSIPLSPREIDPSIPEAMEAITMKAMASQLDKRYVSADAMLADLEEFRKNPNISFDYTQDDLLVGQEDEPTQVLGANSPQSVPLRPAHTERFDKQATIPIPVQPKAEPEPEDEDEEEETDPKSRLVVILAATLICAVGLGAFLWVTVLSSFFTQDTTLLVPELTGKGYTLEDAQNAEDVKENGFTVIEGEQVLSETVPAGEIVSQSPAAGTKVKEGQQEITVDISAGPTGLVMPELYEKDKRVAESILSRMGLVVEWLEDYSPEVAKEHILAQHPQAGENVQKGDTVTLTVSLGPEVKEVPMISVVGLTLSSATRVIEEDLGLKVGKVEEVYNDEVEAGLVCFQSIQAKTTVPEGTVINLHVSRGAEILTPPEASETPAASAEPSKPAVVRKDVTIDLPTDDRKTVSIQATVGGVQQFSQPMIFETRMRLARFTIEGSGTQEVVIYMDGEETMRYTEEFSS